MSKTKLFLLLILVVLIFSAVPIAELWFLREAGFDVIAHVQATSSEGSAFQFYFEAFGAVAFVIAQTIVLTCLFVWAVKTLGPIMLQSAVNRLFSYLNRL